MHGSPSAAETRSQEIVRCNAHGVIGAADSMTELRLKARGTICSSPCVLRANHKPEAFVRRHESRGACIHVAGPHQQ